MGRRPCLDGAGPQGQQQRHRSSLPGGGAARAAAASPQLSSARPPAGSRGGPARAQGDGTLQELCSEPEGQASRVLAEHRQCVWGLLEVGVAGGASGLPWGPLCPGEQRVAVTGFRLRSGTQACLLGTGQSRGYGPVAGPALDPAQSRPEDDGMTASDRGSQPDGHSAVCFTTGLLTRAGSESLTQRGWDSRGKPATTQSPRQGRAQGQRGHRVGLDWRKGQKAWLSKVGSPHGDAGWNEVIGLEPRGSASF